jgi:allantoinase
MENFDLIVRGGTVVTESEVRAADIAVADGRITRVDPDLGATAREEIDARGLHVFPGLIDAHVHFNEPGRAEWEGLETGSSALAAGGGTLFFDMPLNAHPPTLDAAGFKLKLAGAERSSRVDFAFWGGLVPQNLDRLEELAAAGVVGFKAFMADSGIDDFPRVDDDQLREGMKRAAWLGLPVAVHAESEAMTRRLARERIERGQISAHDYLASRPVAAELDAIGRALDMAGETGCALHVVHVSCGEGIRLITDARARGVDVSCETCPHYLVLTADDLERLGAVAKCAPPLRAPAQREELWRCVLAGVVTTIGSDHSPSPPHMKKDTSFFRVWGGISGVQHTLPLLLTEGYVNRQMALPAIARLTSSDVARRFRLGTKGDIAVGHDADLALVDLGGRFEVRSEELWYRHRQSPYIGRRLQGRVVRTLVRGQTVFRDGKMIAKARGRLVKPIL